MDDVEMVVTRVIPKPDVRESAPTKRAPHDAVLHVPRLVNTRNEFDSVEIDDNRHSTRPVALPARYPPSCEESALPRFARPVPESRDRSCLSHSNPTGDPVNVARL